MSTHNSVLPESLDLIITGSGLESDSQLSIKTAFNPFWLQAMEWQSKVETVTDPKVARESRLLLKKIRVEAGHKKDELKTELLKRTRAIDGAFRAIETTISPLELKLDGIEKAEQLAREAAAKAPDREKLIALAAALNATELPDMATAAGKEAMQEVDSEIFAVVSFIKRTADSL